jgi:hypothetical protein
VSTTRLCGGVAALTITGLALTGCVTIETEPRADGDPTPASTPSDPARSASAPPSTEPTEAASSPATAQLLDSGADYARAVQAFSPRLELWTIDGDSITLVERNCVGQKPIDVTGTLGPDAGGVRTVTWDLEDGELNPLSAHGGGYDTSPENTLEIDEEHLVEKDLPADRYATPDVDEQEAEFIGMCRDLGETVVGIG